MGLKDDARGADACPPRRINRHVRRGCLILGGLLLLFLIIALTMLALIDRGFLDGPIARTASFKLGRTVRFQHLRTHLLAHDPSVRIEGLTIGNPAWLPGGDLAEVARSPSICASGRCWPGKPG